MEQNIIGLLLVVIIVGVGYWYVSGRKSGSGGGSPGNPKDRPTRQK